MNRVFLVCGACVNCRPTLPWDYFLLARDTDIIAGTTGELDDRLV